MAEPSAVAEAVEEVVPGVLHWRLRDDRIGGFWSAAHAVQGVLIDPLPLAEEASRALGGVSAIILTTSSHQRSAWRLRRELGVPVYLPDLTRESDEEPDERYREGDALPGGLEAIFTPGAGTTQHSLLRERVLFTPDLFVRSREGPLGWVPFQFMHDPEEARRSGEKLLDYDFDALCTGHGAPLAAGAKQALRGLVQAFAN